MKDFLQAVKDGRKDVSDWLIHFTRGKPEEATTTLNKILSDGALIGQQVICFSESPICEFKRVIELCQEHYSDPRFAPFGIAVKKTWLFEQGGRHVIYGPRDEKADFANEKHAYRYVVYDPSDQQDFSWQREWRVRTKRLAISPSTAVVIVPDEDASVDLTCVIHEDGEYMDGEHVSFGGLERKWQAFKLDDLTIHIEGDTSENPLIDPSGMK